MIIKNSKVKIQKELVIRKAKFKKDTDTSHRAN